MIDVPRSVDLGALVSELDIPAAIKRLQVNLDELESILNEVVEHELAIVLSEISDDSKLMAIVISIGEDNIRDAARQAVSRWVDNLR